MKENKIKEPGAQLKLGAGWGVVGILKGRSKMEFGEERKE